MTGRMSYPRSTNAMRMGRIGIASAMHGPYKPLRWWHRIHRTLAWLIGGN